MRIAIVEDNRQERDRLAAFTRQYFEEAGTNCTLTLFSDGDEILENYSADWDLILLDIQMARLDGLATAEKIRKLDENVFLVFVTNMAHYAIKGYSVRALDFLLKPINYHVLKQLLQQVERMLAERKRKMITLPAENGLTRINVNDIYYVEVENHVLSVVTRQGTYRLRGTISGIEDTLREYDFFRCNNCYLVNLSQISHVEQGMLVVGGHELAISRPRQKKFLEALTSYIGGTEGYE